MVGQAAAAGILASKYNIFKPMPAGPVSITANGDFKIELVMIEKRGEPKWI